MAFLEQWFNTFVWQLFQSVHLVKYNNNNTAATYCSCSIVPFLIPADWEMRNVAGWQSIQTETETWFLLNIFKKPQRNTQTDRHSCLWAKQAASSPDLHGEKSKHADGPWWTSRGRNHYIWTLNEENGRSFPYRHAQILPSLEVTFTSIPWNSQNVTLPHTKLNIIRVILNSVITQLSASSAAQTPSS